MQQEVRFALVMYGGVSLAVYMNGVTQEFFHLVRATAPGSGDGLSGAEAVYRELGRIANARFVVDIVSGSSAGGINAIFLGKALANGQSLDHLSRLWIEEADLRTLWNRSLLPKSLLSGQAMYGMLRRALDAMDGMDRRPGLRPLQPEIDVFLTATDIQGLELPLRLADEEVTERRHKNVFHFRFDTEGTNDFSRRVNPFLAFAGRATSSFPVAFEPARLVDYPEALDSNACHDADKFFPDYVAANADYTRTAFGDGGYLNNKPFDHAVHQIPSRISDLPVRRILMYVEPTPERSSGNAARGAPGPIRNSIEALITLHQYETIREDWRQVLERNELVDRVREITAQVDRDVEKWRSGRLPRLSGEEYSRRTLSEEVHARGPGYAGYHRLKVRAVTDDLARMTGMPRQMVEEWRSKTYREEDSASSESGFLLNFDLGYRQRRLRFLIAKLDETGGSPELRTKLSRIGISLATPRWNSGRPGRCDREEIRTALRSVTIPAAEQIERCLAGSPLKRYFDRFEDYDQVTFPILYDTAVGETEPVEIFRASPLDSHSLIDEASPTEKRRKLAGTTLYNFGAFLKRSWRVNDMLWGRLDGAERIVRCVLPKGSPEAERLVREAHLAILREHFGEDADTVYQKIKSYYEVDRRIGWVTAAGTGVQALCVLFKMALSALSKMALSALIQ